MSVRSSNLRLGLVRDVRHRAATGTLVAQENPRASASRRPRLSAPGFEVGHRDPVFGHGPLIASSAVANLQGARCLVDVVAQRLAASTESACMVWSACCSSEAISASRPCG